MINPYGPNGGWNSTADYRIAMLERLAAKTGDGRYRFGAQKLFNYLRYQHRDPKSQTLDSAAPWLIALASIWADNRFDFGIEFPGQADNLIREEVVLTLDVKATPGEADFSAEVL